MSGGTPPPPRPRAPERTPSGSDRRTKGSGAGERASVIYEDTPQPRVAFGFFFFFSDSARPFNLLWAPPNRGRLRGRRQLPLTHESSGEAGALLAVPTESGTEARMAAVRVVRRQSEETRKALLAASPRNRRLKAQRHTRIRMLSTRAAPRRRRACASHDITLQAHWPLRRQSHTPSVRLHASSLVPAAWQPHGEHAG